MHRGRQVGVGDRGLELSVKLMESAGLEWELRRSQFENNYFTEMCSGSEAGSYLRLIVSVYHSTLGLRVIKNKKKSGRCAAAARLLFGVY